MQECLTYSSPWPVSPTCGKSRFDWIEGCVPHCVSQFLVVPAPVIEVFIRPEWLACSFQETICLAGREPFEDTHIPVKFIIPALGVAHHAVNMVRHDAKRMNDPAFLALQPLERLADEIRKRSTVKEPSAGFCRVQIRLNSKKLSLPCPVYFIR